MIELNRKDNLIPDAFSFSDYMKIYYRKGVL